VSLLHTFGGVSAYFYRHVGFGMLLATVLGSIGLAVLGEGFSELAGLSARRFHRRFPTRSKGIQTVVVLLGVTVLFLSLIVVHTSPYMYKPGNHVTETSTDGYETALQHKPDVQWDGAGAVWYGGIRTGPERYAEGLRIEYPIDRRIIFSGAVPNGSLADLPRHYRTHNETITRRDHYLPILRYDRQRETVAYRELRYRQAGFEAVRGQPAVSRIQDNGGMAVYYVDIDLFTG
jgi:hypothetical protein